MSAAFKGIEQVIASLGRKSAAIDARVYAASKLVGAEAVRAIKLQFPRGKKNDGHVRADGRTTDSPIGKPPMIRSGNLERGIRYQSRRVGFGTYKVTAGPTAIYGRAVELGGAPTWPKGTNYPYVEPAAKMLLESGAIFRTYQRAITEGLKVL